MKTIQLMLLYTAIAVSSVAGASDIWEGSETMDDGTNAKMMRHLAKQRAQEASMTAQEREAARQDTGGCGAVDIGNVQGSKGQDVETVVIIKGDVVNANNNCR